MSRLAMKGALLWLAASSVAGCGLAGEPTPIGPRNECSEDADCASSRCDLDRGMCVAAEVEPLDVYLDVVPPGSYGPSDSFGPYALAELSRVDLRLPAPVRVEGTVRHEGRAVRAQVRFRPLDVPLPERAPRITTQTFDPELPDHPATYDFEVQLVPGRSYSVRIVPEGDDRALLPPLRGMLELGEDGQHVDIVYEPAELVTVLGDVSSVAGPEDGLEVSAIDAVTGDVVSSIATTGADPERPGAFEIRMLAGSPAWLLRLAPTRDRVGVFPTFVVDPRYLTSLVPPGTSFERAQVLVPAIESAVRFAGTVEYPASIAAARPVEGAIVTLHAAEIVDDATNMVGRLELTLTTDAMGRFDGAILPGEYEIEVSSASSPELGILVETRSLRPAAGSSELIGSVLSLPPRTLLGGLAQAPGAEPLPNAAVRALATGLPLDGLADPDLARRARSTDGVTSSTGDFRLALDVGVFDLVVEPPVGSGYPWWIEPGVGIGGGTRPISRVAELRAPVPVEGTLESYEGARIAGAEIHAYTRVDGRLLAIGRVSTDEAGELLLLLPPSL